MVEDAINTLVTATTYYSTVPGTTRSPPCGGGGGEFLRERAQLWVDDATDRIVQMRLDYTLTEAAPCQTYTGHFLYTLSGFGVTDTITAPEGFTPRSTPRTPGRSP